MAGKIKGITIEIGGDTKGLQRALKGVDGDIRATQKELREVEAALKLDPGNTELVAQKQKLLARQTELTEEKLDALREAHKRCSDEMRNGTEINAEMQRKLTREITFTEKKLNDLNEKSEKKPKENTFAGIDVSSLKVAGAASAAVGAIGAVYSAVSRAANETREYREDMNRLETAFISSNKSAEAAHEIYDALYTILGEEDRSVEAAGHLAKLVNNEKELAKWGDICAGVSATFGDSLPIEGLTEAANETAKTGKVTGVLADALNWVGENEDEFNVKLAQANDESERSALITDTLCQKYIGASQTFKEMNADVIKNREVTQRLTDIYAQFGAAVEPALTWAKGVLADFAQGAAIAFGIVKDETGELIDAIDSMAKSQEESTSSIDDNAAAQLSQVQSAQILYNELKNLTDESGRIKDKDKERADFIIGELNNALGIEIERNGNVIASLDNIGASINEVIAKKQAKILLDAQEEKYAEAVKNEAAAWDNLCAIKQTILEKEQYISDIRAKEDTASVTEIQAAEQARNALAGLEAEYDRALEVYQNYSNVKQTYADASAAAMEGDSEKVISILNGQNNAIERASAIAEENAQTLQQELGEALWKAAANAEVAMEAYKANATDENRKTLDAMLAQLEAARTDFVNAGGYLPDGIIVGMNGKAHILNETMRNLVLNGLASAKAALGIQSPSRVYRDEVGKMIVEGIEIGIRDEGVELTEEMDRLLNELELQRDLGAISEEEYYKHLEEARNEYFTVGTEGWWKYTQKIIEYENKQLSEQEKVLEASKKEAVNTFSEIAEASEKSINSLVSERDKFSAKLNTFATSSLYNTSTITISGGAADGSDVKITRTKLGRLRENIDKLHAYTAALKAVKAKGVPKGFFELLRDMGIEEGTAFANAILSTPDDELAAYIDDWTYIQKLSDESAEELYGDDFEEAAQKAKSEMSVWRDELPEEWKESGELSASAFGEAFYEEITKIRSSLREVFENAFGGNFSAVIKTRDTPEAVHNNTRNVSYTNNFYSKTATASELTRALRQNEQQAALL